MTTMSIMLLSPMPTDKQSSPLSSCHSLNASPKPSGLGRMTGPLAREGTISEADSSGVSKSDDGRNGGRGRDTCVITIDTRGGHCGQSPATTRRDA
jgi:hypothetical protein